MAEDDRTKVLTSDAPVPRSVIGDWRGAVIDRKYRVIRQIGAGSMGYVFEATELASERRVALKVLKPERALREVFLKRFLREARAVSMIDHPNVVKVYEFGEAVDGPIYMAMEFVEGEDLCEVLRREDRLPWPRARTILTQTAEALCVVHGAGIIHRDIKPANCVLNTIDGRDAVKLLDFGVAKLGGLPGERDLTNASDLIGTVLYMSPEQALGQPADERTDIYALGVMAYELVTGRVPFPGNDIFKVIARHLKKPPPPPRQTAPELPPAAEEAILKALAKQSGGRFQSMAEFRDALVAACALEVGPHCPPQATDDLPSSSMASAGASSSDDERAFEGSESVFDDAPTLCIDVGRPVPPRPPPPNPADITHAGTHIFEPSRAVTNRTVIAPAPSAPPSERPSAPPSERPPTVAATSDDRPTRVTTGARLVATSGAAPSESTPGARVNQIDTGPERSTREPSIQDAVAVRRMSGSHATSLAVAVAVMFIVAALATAAAWWLN